MNKHFLLLSGLILHVVSCKESSETAPAGVPRMSPIQQGAARLDAALIHDYELIKEQRQKWKNSPSLPPLPEWANDSTFLRRACIDLAGRLPRPDEARTFLEDSSPEKRAKLTEALVREPGAAEVRFRILAEAFRVKDDDPAIGWLRQAAAEDRPYAEIITHMIGGGQMLKRDQGNALRTSVETAFALLGEDFYCALCHYHPFNDHTQRECYSFAACFAENETVHLPSDYLYRDGQPGDVVEPALPRLHRGYTPNISRNSTPDAFRTNLTVLQQVARWLTEDEESRRFALVASLRIWNSLFGMPGQMVDHTLGGVEDAPPWHGIHRKPILHQASNDCFSSSPRGSPTWVGLEINSPADFTQSIKVLIEEFLRCGGRLGEFQQLLACTAAYQRNGIDYNLSWNGTYLTPAPQIRRLPSEVIWKTVSGEFDLQLPQVPPPGHSLRMLGRGTREWTDESLTPISHELVRWMMNDQLVALRTAKAENAEDSFLELLGRKPTSEEQIAISHHAAAEQDVTWALLNTAEFMFRP